MTGPDRIARWEAAAAAAGCEVDRNALRAYMEIADAEQAAVLLWAADHLAMPWRGPGHEGGMDEARRQLRAWAHAALPCDPVVPCESGGEPCTAHERLMAHADGEHELCGTGCTSLEDPGEES